MKKWALALMLVAVMGLPVLACGFPLPVAIEQDGMTVTTPKPVCAEGEAAESCQLRQDAYELMAGLQSGSITDMDMVLTFDAEGDSGDMHFTGSYDFVVNSGTGGLGIDVHAMLDEATFNDAGDVQDISEAQFIIVDGVGYSLESGADTWTQEDLTTDSDTVLGLALVLGMGGGNVDLFSDPAAFTVEVGEDMEMDGQTMHVQTLSLDITGLLMSPDALGGLMDAGSSASGGALSEDELGMSSEDLAMIAPMLMGFMGDSYFTTTIYIGADDGLIHRVEDEYVFKMDMSALDPESAPISMVYMLEGNISNHNGVATIMAPEGAVEGEGGLFDELGGGTGLGDSLFGG